MQRLIHQFLKSFLTFLIIGLFFAHPTISQAFSGEGAGNSSSPYLVTNCTQLTEIDDALSAYYAVTQDFSCAGVLTDNLAGSGSFTGTLDGRGHTISEIEISTSGYAGLFEVSDTGAVIKNIHLRDGFVETGSSSYSGSFVGRAEGDLTITDSSSNLTNSGESPAGLVGLITGGTTTIERSYFTGDIQSDWVYSAGLVGIASSGVTLNISDSYTSGTYTGQDYLGGLVGLMYDGTITRSYSSADITGNDGDAVGGLIGSAIGSTNVTNSFFAGTVGGTSGYIGSVFGFGDGTYSSVYYDSYLSSAACSGNGEATCNAVNASNVTPNYFKNNTSNAPLSSWNFNGVWLTTATYPILGVASSNSTPSNPVSMPAPWQCPLSAPSSAPDLFQINTTRTDATVYFAPASNSDNYYVAYGYLPGDYRYGAEFPAAYNNGVIAYTIHLLSPNTAYYFQVRGGHGCMPGVWSNILRAKTTSGAQTIFYK